MRMAAVLAVVVAASMLTGGVSAASAAPSSQIQKARAYITKHGADANRVQANVLLAQLGMLQVSKSATQANLNKLAIAAQDSHDNLDALRNNFAESDSGAFGDAELFVFMGANDLKNSMGALVAWTGSPNAATLAHFVSQFKKGRSEWNTGIRSIWKMAHKKKPPLV